MNILRLSAIRTILAVGLIAALALPVTAPAEATTKTVAKTATHKTTTKKVTKKKVKKTTKKSARKTAKKPTRKSPAKVADKTVRKTPEPVAITGEYVSAADNGQKIHAEPSDKAEVRWEIFDGFPLQVKKRQGEWLQVTDFEGDTGWVRESLVTGNKSVIVRKKRINLRQDPNSDENNPIVAIAKYGVVFTPIEKKDDWLKVRYDAQTDGWVNKDLVWPSNPLD